MAALNDPAVLQAVLPSCTEARRLGPGRFVATITKKIGPMPVSVDPQITLSPLTDGRARMTIAAGGFIIGRAQAVMDLYLKDAPAGTRLVWQGEISATGLAGRMVAESGAKTAEVMQNVFVAFKRKINPPEPEV